jgi:hypothetical protein
MVPPTSDNVLHVVLGGSGVEMPRIDARRVIAVVAGHLMWLKRPAKAVGQHPTVGLLVLAGQDEDTVAPAASLSGPFMASVRAAAGVDAFGERRIDGVQVAGVQIANLRFRVPLPLVCARGFLARFARGFATAGVALVGSPSATWLRRLTWSFAV